MNSNIVVCHSPEKIEIDKKRLESAKLEEILAERELELITLKNQLEAFESRYLLNVGGLYAKLDALEAEIAELELSLHPQDENLKQRFENLHIDARKSTEEANRIKNEKVHIDFQPSENIKKLYREAAKCIHPDFARNSDDAARRHKVMSEVNCAYKTGDSSRLQAILDDWNSRIDVEQIDDIEAQLVRLIRKIAYLENCIRKTEKAIAEAQQSNIFALFEKEASLKSKCRNLMSEMAFNINAQIAAKLQILTAMKEQGTVYERK